MSSTQMLEYRVNPDFLGVNGYGRQINTVVYNTKVSATTDTTLVVPSTPTIGQILPRTNTTPKVLAVINYQAAATVFVANGITAAPNGGGTFTLKPGVINPAALLVDGGDTLHFYPLADAYVSVEFYFVN